MAEKNNKTEEDYLDSLLKSVMGNDDNADNDDEFLSEFENEFLTDEEKTSINNLENIDLSSKDISSEELNNNNLNNKDLNRVDSVKPATETSILNNYGDSDRSPDSKDSNENQDSEHDSIDILDAIDGLNLDEIVSDDESDKNKNPEESVSDIINDAIEKNDSSIDEDMQGLYNILGYGEGDGESADDNGSETQKESKKDKKNKKNKKNKKSLFSRKKKEKLSKAEDLQDDILSAGSGMTGETDNVDAYIKNEEKTDVFDGQISEKREDTGESDSSLDEQLDNAIDGLGDLNFDETPDNLDFALDESSDSMEDTLGLDETEALDENEKLIKQMDEGEIDEDELLSDKEDNKKKEKKEKKKKEKKPKKQKKPKVKKEKKQKGPKKPDEIIPVSKVFLAFSVTFIVVLILVVKLGGQYSYYNNQKDKAVEYYVNQNYEKAYYALSGMEIKEPEKIFYEQLEVIMFMDRHYQAYKNYISLEDFEHGLDSLVKGVKMYDKYQAKGSELGCLDDMTNVLNWIDEALNSTYGISEDQAREIYRYDDDDYSSKIRPIAKKAESAYEEKKESEQQK